MAEIKDIMGENDFTVDIKTTRILQNILPRNKIELVLGDEGYTLPLPQDVSFYIGNLTKVFFIRYFVLEDEYVYIKMKEAL